MHLPKQVYFNLPSTSLSASSDFIAALGLTKKTLWSGENTQCFIYTDSVYIFYHVHETYKAWLPSNVSIASSKSVNSCIITLVAASKADVDEMITKAIEAGGTRGPNMLEGTECEGNMYSRSVLDPDGHLFEVVCGLE